LTKLFIGAEGTLGIVTEGMSNEFALKGSSSLPACDLAATIRLAPLLPTTVAISGFPSVENAVKAVGEVINLGVPIRKPKDVDLAREAWTDRRGWSPQNAWNYVIRSR
jgi:D-lactate dehydrogenase (cytochrome)